MTERVDLDELEHLMGLGLYHSSARMLKTAIAELRAHREREASGGWIRCEERMPAAETRVLVSGLLHGQASIFEAFHMPRYAITHRWQFRNGMYCAEGEVTHWQPLPPAPEEAT